MEQFINGKQVLKMAYKYNKALFNEQLWAELHNKKKAIQVYYHVMQRRFKLIYYYDEVKDVVTIMDIWDTRMNPNALIRRIK